MPLLTGPARPSSERKRKREVQSKPTRRRPAAAAARANVEDEAFSDLSDESGEDSDGSQARSRAGSVTESESDDATQTDAQRRLRLAEQYLENLRPTSDDEEDGSQNDTGLREPQSDTISARLQEDAAESQGRTHKRIAATLEWQNTQGTMFRADTLATTGVALCSPFVYTVSKDTTLIKWRLASPNWSSDAKKQASEGLPTTRRKKPKLVAFRKGGRAKPASKDTQHHTDAILCVAASADGRFVATGGRDKRLIIWDAKDLRPIRVFTQHRDAVCAVAFRGKSNQLFSASKDRTVKIWSLNDMAYVETLFGHQDEVVDVAAVGGNHDRCVSVGSRDRSARLWKVAEESQLVFRGGATSKIQHDRPQADPNKQSQTFTEVVESTLDRVIQLDSQLFVTGSDSGALSLFSLSKKKPLHVVPLAHGADFPQSTSDSVRPIPRAITALACVPYSDLFISGSWDGHVRVWRLSDDMKRIEEHASISKPSQDEMEIDAAESPAFKHRGKIPGVINDLAIMQRGERGRDGVCIIAAIGTELRHGRWFKLKGKNCGMLFDIKSRVST